MKRILLILSLLSITAIAKADDVVVSTPTPDVTVSTPTPTPTVNVSTALPSPIGLWQDIKSSSTMHILDNGTPGWFYDYKDHVSMSGVTTEIYKYRHLSGDFGFVKSIDNKGRLVPILGTNIHIGSFLNRFQSVNTAITNLGLNQGLLKYFVAGAWAGHDFNDPMRVIHYGIYSGFRIEIQ